MKAYTYVERLRKYRIEITMEENKSQIIIYQTENGETKLDVRFQDETE
ncbi:hypothetical protein SDC9_152581 [bioreactor metagenome]|uniref:Uncharacterized protein n=1 Tax=bioreactor metagenome TaxID=1076179 RepID=A0A645ETG4_9ZZZZ